MSDQIVINVVQEGPTNVNVNDTGENIYINPITLNQGITNHSVTHQSGGSDELLHNLLGGLNGGQSGQYYHLSSGQYFNLVTGDIVRPSETGNFITTSQTGAFYPRSNPSGYITGVDLSAYVTGDVVRPSETGNFVTTNQTGAFYPASNPSGFITGLDTSVYVTGDVVRPSQTGDFYPRSNPSGYITGVDLSAYVTGDVVRPSQTGNFVTTSQTGAFYASSNPSGYITGVDLSSYATQAYVTGASGSLQIQITNLNNQTGGYVLSSQTGNFITVNQTGAFYPRSNPSGFITGVDLSNYSTISYTTGISGGLQSQINGLNSQTGSYVLQSQTGNFLTTGAADNRFVSSSGNQTVYGTKTFSNDVYINRLYVTGSETIVSTNNFSVQSPYIILNLTGGATDGGIFFVTGSGLTGINDYGPIIGFDHSDKFKFGISTRASDLSSLPTIGSVEQINALSGYLDPRITTLNNQTGSYALKSETGSFVTTSQTGAFYAASNPSGFITGVDLSNYSTIVYTTGISGVLQSQISDLNNGTGSYALKSETGSFLTANSADSLYVNVTGDENISGVKTFTNNIVGSGASNRIPNQTPASTDSTFIATQVMTTPFPTFGGPPPMYKIFEDFPAQNANSSYVGTHGWYFAGAISNPTGIVSNSNLAYGLIQLTTTASSGASANARLVTNGTNAVSGYMHSLFAIPDPTNITFFMGFAGGGSTDYIQYTPASGGWLTKKTQGGNNVDNMLLITGLSGGNFASGTRYKVSWGRPSATGTAIHIATAPWNVPVWNTIYNNTVTHASWNGGNGQIQPYIGIIVDSGAVAKSIIVDYIGIEFTTQR